MKQYYVLDKFGNFFAGFKGGEFYWSSKIGEARELTDINHFDSIKRYDAWREPYIEYIEW